MRLIPLARTCGALVVSIVAALPLYAQQFTLQTGPPAAAMPDPADTTVKKSKNVVFVVRPRGCADLATFAVTARADGIVDGVRRTVRIVPERLPQSGVVAVSRQWPEGAWVVSLSASCGTELAGAIVRLKPGGYDRNGVEILAHHPTQKDIDRALAAQAPASRW